MVLNRYGSMFGQCRWSVSILACVGMWAYVLGVTLQPAGASATPQEQAPLEARVAAFEAAAARIDQGVGRALAHDAAIRGYNEDFGAAAVQVAAWLTDVRQELANAGTGGGRFDDTWWLSLPDVRVGLDRIGFPALVTDTARAAERAGSANERLLEAYRRALELRPQLCDLAEGATPQGAAALEDASLAFAEANLGLQTSHEEATAARAAVASGRLALQTYLEFTPPRDVAVLQALAAARDPLPLMGALGTAGRGVQQATRSRQAETQALEGETAAFAASYEDLLAALEAAEADAPDERRAEIRALRDRAQRAAAGLRTLPEAPVAAVLDTYIDRTLYFSSSASDVNDFARLSDTVNAMVSAGAHATELQRLLAQAGNAVDAGTRALETAVPDRADVDAAIAALEACHDRLTGAEPSIDEAWVAAELDDLSEQAAALEESVNSLNAWIGELEASQRQLDALRDQILDHADRFNALVSDAGDGRLATIAALRLTWLEAAPSRATLLRQRAAGVRDDAGALAAAYDRLGAREADIVAARSQVCTWADEAERGVLQQGRFPQAVALLDDLDRGLAELREEVDARASDIAAAAGELRGWAADAQTSAELFAALAALPDPELTYLDLLGRIAALAQQTESEELRLEVAFHGPRFDAVQRAHDALIGKLDRLSQRPGLLGPDVADIGELRRRAEAALAGRRSFTWQPLPPPPLPELSPTELGELARHFQDAAPLAQQFGELGALGRGALDAVDRLPLWRANVAGDGAANLSAARACEDRLGAAGVGGDPDERETGGDGDVAIALPPLIGWPAGDAVAALERLGLQASLRAGDPAPTQDLAGRVAAAFPADDAPLRAGGTVVLVLHAAASRGAEVPAVIGLPIDRAAAAIESAGFVPVLEVGAETSDPALAGTVAWQGPAAGTEVIQGSDVTLLVYATAIPGLTVPDLVGQPLAIAQRMVAPNGPDSEERLFLDPVAEGAAPSRDRTGVIARQYPEPGIQIPRGTAVRVWVYGDFVEPPPPDEPPLDDPEPEDPIVDEDPIGGEDPIGDEEDEIGGGEPVEALEGLWIAARMYMPVGLEDTIGQAFASAGMQQQQSGAPDLHRFAQDFTQELRALDPDAAQWTPQDNSLPVVVLAGEAARAFSPGDLDSGARFSLPVVLRGSAQGIPLDVRGALLLETVAVAGTREGLLAAAGGNSLNPQVLAIRDGSGRGSTRIDQPGQEGTIDYGPIELGWSRAQRAAAIGFVADIVGALLTAMANDPELLSDGCFIATAVYGDYDAPQLMPLRAFRDRMLKTSAAGRRLVDFYYAHGPGWAARLRGAPGVKALLRGVLDVAGPILGRLDPADPVTRAASELVFETLAGWLPHGRSLPPVDAAAAGSTRQGMLTGRIVARRDGQVQVAVSVGAPPPAGTEVAFSTVLAGYEVSAGRGRVVSVEGSQVWVEVIEGRPQLGYTAVFGGDDRETDASVSDGDRPGVEEDPLTGRVAGLRERARAGDCGPEVVEGIRSAAQAGNAYAQWSMAWLHIDGCGVPQDPVVETEWFRRAAENGHALSMAEMAFAYGYGNGVERDAGAAYQWARRADATGHPYGTFALGQAYQHGWGVEPDAREAARLYQIVAEQGGEYAHEGYHSLGHLYQVGDGVPQDYTAALRYYVLAAELDDGEARNDVGVLYENGWGVAPDAFEAAIWYERAAAAGNARGYFNLAELYEQGRGVPLDAGRAVELYKEAARRGHSRAQTLLQERGISWR